MFWRKGLASKLLKLKYEKLPPTSFTSRKGDAVNTAVAFRRVRLENHVELGNQVSCCKRAFRRGAAGAVGRVACIRRIGRGLGRTGVSWCKGLLANFTN